VERRLVLPTLVILVGTMCLASEPSISDSVSADWRLATTNNGVTIYSRPHSGSSLKEFKATGAISASSRTVHQVIDDIEAYPTFMPYIVECRLIKRESSDSLVTYQRFSPKICCDRDYTLRIWEMSWPTAAGLAYSNSWEPANEVGPAKKIGVVRIKICQGAWLLEPDGTNKTRATYSIYTDTGGLVPSFIANHFSATAIEKVFAAVRKQVKEPKYDATE
jgi:Polyketide cyclase / dehydrase and lipid transport